MRAPVLGFIAFGLVACADEGPPGSIGSQAATLGDTVLVHSASPQVTDTLHPTLATRYGRGDGPPEYLFSAVRRFAVDSEGQVFVHDLGGGIRSFSRDGVFVKVAAGEGRGPSEVVYPVSMVAAGPGQFALVDLGNRRVAHFGEAGAEFTARAPGGYLSYNEGGLVARPNGDLWIRLPEAFGEDLFAVGPRAYGLVSEAGIADSVVVPQRYFDECPFRTQRGFQSGFWEDSREPFNPKVKWTLGRDGELYAGCPASFSFDRISVGGQVTRISWDRSLVEVSEAELEFRASMPVSKAGSHLPAYSQLIPTDDGRTWVALVQPNERIALEPEVAARFNTEHTWAIPDNVVFDVFDPEGVWLASVALPSSVSYSGYPTAGNIVIRGDSIWAIEVDDLGVHTVAKYVVPRLTSGSDL